MLMSNLDNCGGRGVRWGRMRFVAGALALATVVGGWVEAAMPPKIVLIAGEVHQGPGGHPSGTHEYELSARLLKHALVSAGNVSDVRCEVHLGGWPREPKTLDDADTIVVLSDGADRKLEDHPLLV